MKQPNHLTTGAQSMKRQPKFNNRKSPGTRRDILSTRGYTPGSKNGHTTLADLSLHKEPLIKADEIHGLETYWKTEPRWQGVKRSYSAEKV